MMFPESQRKEDCCGCMACSEVCGRSAIRMRQDKKGFFYPVVDKEKCVDCGLCRKVCPMEQNYVGQDAEPDTYAARSRDSRTRRDSSSGGMFTLLAQWVIGQGGVVYGAEFDEEFHVRHGRAETMEEAAGFRTSKYVESDISKVYETLAQDLRDGRVALLTGTPCQISAVSGFLREKRVNTDRLYTCDNVCHGVPSRRIWNDYLDILRRKYIAAGDEITAVNMRSKKASWQDRVMEIRLRSGNLDEVTKKFSFNRIYQSLCGNRPSCFHCRYTSYRRPGDFTLGDFWRAETADIPFDIKEGVNTVLVNTEKGRKLFALLREDADVHQVTKEACWQPHLEYSAKAPSNCQEFWKEYVSAEDKEPVLRKYMKGSLLGRVIRAASPFLRRTGLYGFAGKMYKKVFVGKR